MGFPTLVASVLGRRRPVAEAAKRDWVDLTHPQRQAVARTVRALMDDPAPVPDWARETVVRERVLPLFYDWNGFVALRPGGQVVLFDVEGGEAEPVVDARVRHVAMAEGARRYAGLPFLLPARTPDAVACESCRGTGRLTFGPGSEHLSDKVICECGGLGWLPAARDGRRR